MQIEEALRTAIEYEQRVRDVYVHALEDAGTDMARKVYGIMAREEEDHVRYLESRLEEWIKTETLELVDLDTALPSIDKIRAAVGDLEKKADAKGTEAELKVMEKALEVEKETSAFYEKLVADLPAEARKFFERFLEIEQGHVALVQAEIDALRGDGFWFDMPEFDLEMG